MTPHVRFRLPDGRTAIVPPGGLIGRLLTAACRIVDPRVSEVHGLVSLRGRSLRLYAMRSPVEVDDDLVYEVTLEEGQRIQLALGLFIEVESVFLPTSVLALALPDGSRAELYAQLHSVVILPHGEMPHLEIIAGPWLGAVAEVWSHGEGWSLIVPGHPPEDLRPGRSFRVGETMLHTVLVPTEEFSTSETRRPEWENVPLRIVLRLDTVHLVAEGRPPVTIDGLSARLLTELGQMRYPAHWGILAARLWPEKARKGYDLRSDWDPLMRRLGTRLREHGVRTNLVRKAGHGNVELFLLPGDEIVDES